MDQQPRRSRRKKKKNQNQLLINLIAVLVAVLAIVVVIAIFAQPPQSTHNGDDATGTAGGTNLQDPTGNDPVTTEPIPLVITEPATLKSVAVEDTLTFCGSADPKESVTIGGVVVQRGQDGSFNHTVSLQAGVNEIQVIYKGQTTVYQVEHRYAVQYYYPDAARDYGTGATVFVELYAREDSDISVTLGEKKITMKEDPNQLGSGVAEGFIRYTGTYQMPSTNAADKNMGQFVYTVTHDGVTETYRSGQITCKKESTVLASDPSVTPDYGNYIDVGSGYIVEIIAESAETFNGHTMDDNSDPRVNYLPKGTVDYCKEQTQVGDTQTYKLMRCGRRVYIQKNNWPSKDKPVVSSCYKGTLPDHNEIGVVGISQVGHHTVITFDTMWKAPFYFDLGPQAYTDAASKDYRVTEVTAEYVDITFCYATVFNGTVTIPENNPLFASAELTQRGSDCTLRLKLKKTGGFYGWDAYYNDNDQLCFRFLNPVKATTADNAYGADLTGIRIMIDVGHGGLDGGAYVNMPDGSVLDEAEVNLELALVLKKKLESMGATVLINRTDDSNLNVDERINFLLQEAPDLCICIHQNSAPKYPNNNGAHILYFTPFSQPFANLVYNNTIDSKIYKRTFLETNVYFVARQTTCPVVLTENGFMSNTTDFANMTDAAMVDRKADSMAQAIAAYFLRNG